LRSDIPTPRSYYHVTAATRQSRNRVKREWKHLPEAEGEAALKG
jgi:hypothetical protein